MPRKRSQAATPGYLRARHAFGVEFKGEQVSVHAGEIVPVGHPLLKQIGKDAVAEHFEPVTSFGRWDVATKEADDDDDDGEDEAKAEADEPEVEQATAGPGEKRP